MAPPSPLAGQRLARLDCCLWACRVGEVRGVSGKGDAWGRILRGYSRGKWVGESTPWPPRTTSLMPCVPPLREAGNAAVRWLWLMVMVMVMVMVTMSGHGHGYGYLE